MHTPASIARHPIHPMLITVPIGLWLFSFACDLIRVLSVSDWEANWEIVAFYSMIGGIVGALLAAIPGFIDLMSLPAGIKRIGVIHMSLNLTVVVLFILNAWLRSRHAGDMTLGLSAISIALLGVSGWLGGKMVYTHGAGVEIPPKVAR